jgi:hypothetical protein
VTSGLLHLHLPPHRSHFLLWNCYMTPKSS